MSSRLGATRSALPSALSRDVQNFLSHYPSQSDKPNATQNLTFYQNASPARPSRLKVEELHKSLWRDYSELEHSHSFIQWIFPIREQGVNHLAQPLEKHEIAALRADPKAMDRLLESYRMMLDFYGMKLVDLETGQIMRSDVVAPSQASWRQRYANLERNSHNYLRITRILKSLSEFGFERLNAPWLLFFLVEQTQQELDQPTLVRSMDTYWRWCIREDADREFVVAKIDAVRDGKESWTEEEYIAAIQRRANTGSWAPAPAKEGVSTLVPLQNGLPSTSEKAAGTEGCKEQLETDPASDDKSTGNDDEVSRQVEGADRIHL